MCAAEPLWCDSLGVVYVEILNGMIGKKFFCGLLLGWFVVMHTGCKKELDFEYREIAPIPVIEGVIDEDGARVSITYTTPMGEPMDQSRIADASVTLFDVTTGCETEIEADSEGLFVSSVGGVVGHEYRLEVVMDGCRYESSSVMTAPPGDVSLDFCWVKMPYDYVAVLQVEFGKDADDAERYYWVKVYRNGEPYKWVTVADAYSEGDVVSVAMMTTRQNLAEEGEDDILRDGDVVTVSVAPVSRVMCDYVDALSSGGSNGPRMFEGPLCLGYFMAASIKEAEAVFRPGDIRYL